MKFTSTELFVAVISATLCIASVIVVWHFVLKYW